MIDVELLPCPFCGSPQVSRSIGRYTDERPFTYVECEDCGANGPPSDGDDPKVAIDMWNTRVTAVSVEARVVAGAFWGVLPTKELTFKRPHILTPQSRKGLDDLVSAGLLTVETHKHSGAMTWRPTGDAVKELGKSVSHAFIKEHTFPITTE